MSNYWTGKGKGEKIVLKFNKALLGDVTGLTAPAFYAMITPPGTPTASGQYSATYTPDKAFDGSTSTRWYIRTTGDQWIQIELPEPRFTNGFRWYAGSSYRPNGFTVQGSNDGENWTDIYSDNSANTTGWKEFFWDPAGPFKFYRWTVTSRHSTYLYIYEIELSLGAGNEAAFNVTGMERDPLKYGTPKAKEYAIQSVERYPLTRYWQDDFSGDMEDVEIGANGITLEEGVQSGTYTATLPTADLHDPRLCFDAYEPEGTSITAAYACTDDGDPPDTWTPTDDGELLTITGDYLHLRFTLATEDEGLTPTLQAVWIEEAEAPLDKLLITMTQAGRFNDTEGSLTITYERAKGTLTGIRPVEDFTESFTPTGLEPTPINVQGTITAGIEVEVDFIEVDYIDLGHKNTITAGITVEVDLIPVSVIPP